MQLNALGESRIEWMSVASDEVENRNRRRRNVVVSGTPQSSHESSEDTEEDIRFTKDLFQTLGLEADTVPDASLVGKRSSERPRLLRVRFKDSVFRDSVLRNAKELRKHPKYRSVFINPDRTPLQQKLWRERLSERKKRKDDNKDAVILRNRNDIRENNQTFRRHF